MSKIEIKYLFLLFVVFIAACIETDIYLPAFPDMMNYFNVSEETIQSLLTWNFIGICLAGPLYGPLSDAIGRKKPLLFALGLFLFGSLLTIWADTFDQMLWGRLLQGLGSGGCFTLGTAIIFDAFQEKKAIKALNLLNSSIPFAMAAAPLAGGFLNHMYGFRSNFLAIGLFVLISFAICLFFFDEPLAIEKRKPFETKKILRDFKRVLLCLPFWQVAFICSLQFAAYLAFLSGTSVLFVVEFGMSKEVFPFFQASILGAWLAASLTCNRAIDKWGIGKLKQIGTVLVLFGTAWLAVAAWLAPENPYLITIAMIIFAYGCNWTCGLYFPESMELLPDIKGISASVITSARLLIAALIVGFSSKLYDGSIYPIAGVVVGSLAATLPLMYLYEKRRKALGIHLTEEGRGIGQASH